MNTKNQKNMLMREDGFTLIEIIAVLIILGILAAVAVPKYFDVSDEAKKKAYQGALAEGLSLCSLAYSKAVLVLEGQPTDIQQVFNALAGADVKTGTASSPHVADGTNTSGAQLSGDFELRFSANSGTGSIDIEARVKPSLGWTEDPGDTWRFKSWKMP